MAQKSSGVTPIVLATSSNSTFSSTSPLGRVHPRENNELDGNEKLFIIYIMFPGLRAWLLHLISKVSLKQEDGSSYLFRCRGDIKKMHRLDNLTFKLLCGVERLCMHPVDLSQTLNKTEVGEIPKILCQLQEFREALLREKRMTENGQINTFADFAYFRTKKKSTYPVYDVVITAEYTSALCLN